MDISTKSEIATLLVNKVGFIKKLFKSVYSNETVVDAFIKGKFLSDNEHKESLSIIIKENDRLVTKLNTEIATNITNIKNITIDLGNAHTTLSNVNNELDKAKKIISLLDIEKKELVKKNEDLLKQSKNSKFVDDIKALENKLKEQEEKHKKELQRTLKECTDKFMKITNKLTKEKATLEEIINTHSNTVPNVISAPKVIKNKPGFTCAQIKKIKADSIAGRTTVDLAKEYEVNKSTIARIVNGDTYKDCK